MSVEALWSVEFISNVQGFGAGVAVFETNRVFGGDSQYFYLGTYEIKNGKAKAIVRVTHYAGTPSSIFGNIKEFNLVLEGDIGHDVFDLNGYVQESPNLKIGMRLTRRAELP